ncbi:YdcF family protein [Myxococcota bacterium]|nr:YdcF family protein [Myxococcota bacterium]
MTGLAVSGGRTSALEPGLAAVVGLVVALVVAAALVVALAIVLERRSRGRRAESVAGLAGHARPSLIVVLGCPTRTRRGHPSRYLTGRARAAAEAYHALRTVPILCSGSGAGPGSGGGAEVLDEVSALAALLEGAGVPRAALRFDRAAKRTLDTIEHLSAHHRDERVLLVTQAFHLPRTLLLARARGLDAIGLVAPGPTPGPRGQLREALGQLRAVFDLARPRRAR